ncbi:MAG: LicD family protein [Christensenellaceae bacterium]
MNKLQTKLLAAFSFFHDTCIENDLQYIAGGGTFLGAIRHHGFIPWDDDIDVWMPRPDYEKLIKIMAKEKKGKYLLETPQSNTGGYYYAMGKLYDTTTTAVEKTKFNVKKGINIDVFPLDGLGKTENERKRLFGKMHIINMLISSRISLPRRERNALKNMAIHISSIVPETLVNTQKLLQRFDRQCAVLPYEGSKYVGVLMGSYGMRDVIPSEWLQNLTLYDFESIKIYGVKNYDEYLTYVFGDWRELPPEKERVSPHEFEQLDLDHGYFG